MSFICKIGRMHLYYTFFLKFLNCWQLMILKMSVTFLRFLMTQMWYYLIPYIQLDLCDFCMITQHHTLKILKQKDHKWPKLHHIQSYAWVLGCLNVSNVPLILLSSLWLASWLSTGREEEELCCRPIDGFHVLESFPFVIMNTVN